MAAGLRLAALGILAVCGWMGADGLRRAGAGEWFSRAYLPWDANRLPETATDTRVLALRPVSPFARFRDALSRADGSAGDAFRVAARGVLGWGRNQPGTLLDLGRVALHRWKERGEKADREVGEALLVEYTRRTTHSETEGLRVWLSFVEPSADPWPVFGAVPHALWQVVGAELTAGHPDTAWRFIEPSLLDGSLDPRYAPHVVALARKRRQRSDLGVLRSFAARPDLTPEAVRDLRSVIADLEGIR